MSFLNRLVLLTCAGVVLCGLGYASYVTSPVSDSRIQSAGKIEQKPGKLSPLPVIESVVSISYPEIEHVDPQSANLGASDAAFAGNRAILVDVREKAEFAVSHIDGAVRVDPKAELAEVLSAVGDVQGKKVIVYCSVGARSSALARRVGDGLRRSGAVGVANLSGGIFRWHNEERPLVNASGSTQLVHRFDAYWGRLIKRQEHAVGGE